MLPHRYPFLLLDRVTRLDPGKSAQAIKNVTVNEPFFGGHFPERPVMPGVLILEAMAQAAGILMLHDRGDREDSLIYLAGADNVRFRRPVVPGDQLVFDVEVQKARRMFAKIEGKASVDGEVVAEALLTSAMVKR